VIREMNCRGENRAVLSNADGCLMCINQSARMARMQGGGYREGHSQADRSPHQRHRRSGKEHAITQDELEQPQGTVCAEIGTLHCRRVDQTRRVGRRA
jgi:hypothetical protein